MKEQRCAEIKRELNRPTLDRAFDLVDPLDWEEFLVQRLRRLRGGKVCRELEERIRRFVSLANIFDLGSSSQPRRLRDLCLCLNADLNLGNSGGQCEVGSTPRTRRRRRSARRTTTRTAIRKRSNAPRRRGSPRHSRSSSLTPGVSSASRRTTRSRTARSRCSPRTPTSCWSLCVWGTSQHHSCDVPVREWPLDPRVHRAVRAGLHRGVVRERGPLCVCR